MKKTRSHSDDLRGVTRLAVEATKGVTDLVEAMHHAIGEGPDILGRPFAIPVRLLTAPTYGSIRVVTKLVGTALDAALAQLAPLLGDGSPGPERDAVHAALNGVLGDYLKETNNPLAIEMTLVHKGTSLDLDALEIPNATSKLLVLVHGSSMNERQWCRKNHDHGAALSKSLGYTPIYVRYNSGLHVSENGRALASLLERVAAPFEEIVLLGHSMGGLVARSASHYGDASAWREKLRGLITLGTPHHGAPLERGGNWIDVLLDIHRYSAPLARLGRIRSAGVTDLRYGNVLDEDWKGRDRFEMARDPRTPLPLPKDVACFAIAGTTTAASKKTQLASDGMVPVESALGRSEDLERALAFDATSIVFETSHLDLLASRGAYETMHAWLKDSLRP